MAKTLEDYKRDFDNVISETEIKCPICGEIKGGLSGHIKSEHGLTWLEVKEKYGSRILVTCPKAMINAASKTVRTGVVAKVKVHNENKRLSKFEKGNFKCRVCGIAITYEQYCNGTRHFCQSAECRSKNNSANGKCADPNKIKEGLRKSKVWVPAQANSLRNNLSWVEKDFVEAIRQLYKIDTQIHVEINERHRFIDIHVLEKNIYIEIDGIWHFDVEGNYIEEDKVFENFCANNAQTLIRIDVTSNKRIVLFLKLLKLLQKDFRGIAHITKNGEIEIRKEYTPLAQ